MLAESLGKSPSKKPEDIFKSPYAKKEPSPLEDPSRHIPKYPVGEDKDRDRRIIEIGEGRRNPDKKYPVGNMIYLASAIEHAHKKAYEESKKSNGFLSRLFFRDKRGETNKSIAPYKKATEKLQITLGESIEERGPAGYSKEAKKANKKLYRQILGGENFSETEAEKIVGEKMKSDDSRQNERKEIVREAWRLLAFVFVNRNFAELTEILNDKEKDEQSIEKVTKTEKIVLCMHKIAHELIDRCLEIQELTGDNKSYQDIIHKLSQLCSDLDGTYTTLKEHFLKNCGGDLYSGVKLDSLAGRKKLRDKMKPKTPPESAPQTSV